MSVCPPPPVVFDAAGSRYAPLRVPEGGGGFFFFWCDRNQLDLLTTAFGDVCVLYAVVVSRSTTCPVGVSLTGQVR